MSVEIETDQEVDQTAARQVSSAPEHSTEANSAAADHEYAQYRALSSLAVASLVVGLFSAVAWLDWLGAAVPVVGVVLGALACRQIARRSDELSGMGIARAGLALSAVFLITGLSRLSYVYATEVPEGYTRISYDQLQPNPDVTNEVVPPSALALDGQKVFIKGYPLSGRDITGIRQFILVRDQGDCCFGGKPKLTDQIQVTLADPLRLNYELRLLRVAGTFHVKPTVAANGLPTTLYYLEADHLQ